MPYELCDICFVRFPNPTKIFQQLCDDCDQDIKESLGQVIGNISSDYKKTSLGKQKQNILQLFRKIV